VDADVPVEPGFEVIAGAADAVEGRSLQHRRVVNRNEAAFRDVDGVDRDVVAARRRVVRADGRPVARRHRRRVYHRVTGRVREGPVRGALARDEVVLLVVVGVPVRHRNQRVRLVELVVEPDPDVLVGAGPEVAADADDAVEGRPLEQRAVVHRDEAALREFDLVDDDRRAAGPLVGHADRRADGHLGVVDDDVALVGRRGPVHLAAAGDERVRAVAVGIEVRHRDDRPVLLEGLVERDRHVRVVPRLEVRGRSADAREDVLTAVVQAGVVDGHEPALGEVHVLDDHRLAAGRLVCYRC